MTRATRKILLLLAAIAITLGMFSLPPFARTALAVGTEYHIGITSLPNSYATLQDFYDQVVSSVTFSFQNGDMIILHDDDNSLSRNLVIPASVTIQSAVGAGPYTISTDPMLSAAVIHVQSGGNLTLENINVQGNTRGGYPAIHFSDPNSPSYDYPLTIHGTVNITGGDGEKFIDSLGNLEGSDDGGSAIQVDTGSLTIIGDGTGVFTGGVGISGNTDGVGIDCDTNALTIAGGGRFTFAGGQGASTTQGRGGIAGAFATSGTPTVSFHGLSGLECEGASIGGGHVAATGTEVGAIINDNLDIAAGAALIAEGRDRGMTFKGTTISGAGNLTARATGQGNPRAGFGVGIFSNSPTGMELVLTGNVACSGPLGGIGAIAGTAQLTLKDGPAAGKTWVIDGTPEKAFAQFDIPNRFAPFPRANILFTGALAGGTYDTDVSIFRLPLSTPGTVITGLPASYILSTGDRVSWTPQPTGGIWNFDRNYLSMTKDGDKVTFIAIKVGATSATYTANGVSHTVSITIIESVVPQTGDNSTITLWIVFMLAALCGIGAITLYRKKHTTSNPYAG